MRSRVDEFVEGDKVLLQVSPILGVVHFRARRTSSPRFISPYNVVEHVDELAYRFALPNILEKVQDVFHILTQALRSGTLHVLDLEALELDDIFL